MKEELCLTDRGTVQELLSRHGFHFSKAMGQNFLVNPGVCPRMAQACGASDPGCAGVLEIGPGIGVLTRELSRVARKVVSVELDGRLFPLLEETLAGVENVRLVQGDVLELDLETLAAREFGPGEGICVCANLPYYITSPVIMGLLESGLPLRCMTFLVQKEAAQRICAKPGSRDCGAISAGVWYRSEPEILFPVGRGSFVPAPKVDSAVIRLTMRSQPPVALKDEARFFAMIRQAFSQRRKTAANAIAAGGTWQKAQVEAVLLQLGLPETIRAEAMTLEQLAGLANLLEMG